MAVLNGRSNVNGASRNSVSKSDQSEAAKNTLDFAIPDEEKRRMNQPRLEKLVEVEPHAVAKTTHVDKLEGRFYVTLADGIVIADKREIVARSGSRVNATGGRVTAEDGADVRAAFGSYIEFLPGSKGIIEAGTDVRLWPGAVVKVVPQVKPYLHHH